MTEDEMELIVQSEAAWRREWLRERRSELPAKFDADRLLRLEQNRLRRLLRDLVRHMEHSVDRMLGRERERMELALKRLLERARAADDTKAGNH